MRAINCCKRFLELPYVNNVLSKFADTVLSMNLTGNFIDIS